MFDLIEHSDNLKSSTKTVKMLIAGVDDAGRGPIIKPLAIPEHKNTCACISVRASIN